MSESIEAIEYHVSQIADHLKATKFRTVSGDHSHYEPLERHFATIHRLLTMEKVNPTVLHLKAIVKGLAESNPIDSEYEQCVHCSTFFRTGDAEHDSSCLWLQAKKLVEE